MKPSLSCLSGYALDFSLVVNYLNGLNSLTVCLDPVTNLYVCMCTCVLYMCACVHVCAFVHMCVCMHVHVCTCVRVYMCTCVHVCSGFCSTYTHLFPRHL